MGAIQVTSTFPNVPPDRLEDFKALIHELVALARQEPGTIQYDFFFSEDETELVVRETYADSDAVLAHLANMGPHLGRLVELGGGFDVEGFGDPEPELAEAIAAMNVKVYVPFASL